MANKKKINPTQPQVSLRKTKQYKPTGTPSAKGPYDRNQRVPYGPRGIDYRDAIALTESAAKNPWPTIGFNIGQAVGNWVDRNNDKVQEKRRNELGDALEAELASRYQNEANPFSAVQVPVDVKQAEDQANNSEDMQAAQQAAETAKVAGQEALATGQVPTTAAGVNALGMNAKDERQFAVQRAKADRYAEWGPNPTQAQLEQKKMAEAAEQLNNVNMAGMNENELYSLIDKLGSQNSRHISKSRVDANKDYYKNFYKQKAINDTYSVASQSASNYMFATPEQKNLMKPQMLELSHRLETSGYPQLAEMVKAPLYDDLKIAQARDNMQYENNLKLDNYIAQKEIDKLYPSARASRSGVYSGDSSGSGRGRKTLSEKEELVKRIKDARSMIGNGILSEEKQKEYSDKLEPLVVRYLEWDGDEVRTSDDWVNAAEAEGDSKFNRIMRQARAKERRGASSKRIVEEARQSYGDELSAHVANLFNPNHEFYHLYR